MLAHLPFSAAFDATVRQTFVAEMMGDADLPNAGALNSTLYNGARLSGPAIAGVIIASVGTGWAFLLNGVSFLAVLVSLSFQRGADLQVNAWARRHQRQFDGMVSLCHVPSGFESHPGHVVSYQYL